MNATRQMENGTLYSRLLKLLPVFAVGLLSFNCSTTRSNATDVIFPKGSDHPYLVLTQEVKTDIVPQKGFLKKLSRAAFGTGRHYQLNQPTDMAIDSQGRLLIVDAEQGAIQRYTREEQGSWEFDKQFKPQDIKHPLGIATGADLIFVSDLQSATVVALDENFRTIYTIKDDAFSRPGDLCFDVVNHRILIVDPPTNRIFIYSAQGDKIAELGAEQSTKGQLQSPVTVTIDEKTGDIYVIDAIARKIKRYGMDLSFVSSFGKYDQVPGSFAFPKGIALSKDGVIFVSDAGFGNVQMFDPSGALLYFFGENGAELGQFLMPRNLLMDEDQNLYVADTHNHRVQIFKYDAQP